jgi:hypothetical protein
MFRLLVVGALTYVAYRVVKEIIDSVPDDVDPLMLPPFDDGEPLQRRSAAHGVDPAR